MDVNLLTSIVIFVSLVFGVFLGFMISKIKIRYEDKKILKEALEVIEGKKTNTIKIDGEEYPATTFKTRDKDGNEVITELQGGIETKYERQKETFKEEDYNYGEANVSSEGEGSSSSREGKRTIREEKRTPRRSIFGRLRRFG